MARTLFIFAVLLAALSGCDGEPTAGSPEPEPQELLPPTAPENLIFNLVVLYNDEVRGAPERIAAYADLLSPDFIFHFQPADYDSCGCTSWDREAEVEAHANLFAEQGSGGIHSLDLAMQVLPAADLDPPDPEKPGWKQIVATSIRLQLLIDRDDGFLVDGAQAKFLMAPVGDRWTIGEWHDLPIPGASEAPTWGSIKARYR